MVARQKSKTPDRVIALHGFFVLDGKRAVAVQDALEWGAWFESASKTGARTVARDTVGDCDVSTVFLGLDHSFGGGPPLLFETMVFGGPHDQAQDRYSTWDEAEAGHAAMVLRVR